MENQQLRALFEDSAEDVVDVVEKGSLENHPVIHSEAAEPGDHGQSSQPLWQGRILSGPHKNVEFILQSGKQTLGRSENCDIVLWDDSLADLMCTIELVDGFVHVDVGAEVGNFRISGVPSAYRQLELEGATILQLDDFSIGFYREGETLQDQPEAADAARLEPNDAVNELAGHGEDGEREVDGLTPTSDLKHSASKNKRESTPNQPQKIRRMFYPVTLLMVASALLYWFFGGEPAPQQVPQKNRVVEILKLHGLDKLTHQSESNQLTFRGYLRTVDQRQSLLNSLASAAIKADTSAIYVMEEQLKLAEDTLAALGLPQIKVSMGEQLGSLKLEGYVTDEKAWTHGYRRLINDVPHVEVWLDQVDSRSQRIAILQNMIEHAGLQNKVGLVVKDDHIEIKGMLNKSEQQAWEKIGAAFVSRYGSEPLLVAAKAAIKDLKVRSVTMGSIPYVTLASGEILLAGAKLENNYTIQAISTDHIILERDGELLNYYINEDLN